MICYYNVEIQMTAPYEIDDELLMMIEDKLSTTSAARDEVETYRAVLFFKSDVNPEEIKRRIHVMLGTDLHDNVHYIDVIYRWENEYNSDRFVVWSDGHEQNYTGHMEFEED